MVRHRGRTRRRAPQVRQTLPFYMVAWCEWSPCASRRRIPGLLLIFMASEIKPSAAAELTLLPKERPLAAEMKAWVEENLTRLPPDQRALVMGVVHQNLISFEPATVLATLVESSAAGITAAMVAARDAAIQPPR